MSSQIKREREWEAGAGTGAPPAIAVDAKRSRTDGTASERSFSGIAGSGGAILTSQSLERPAQAHPMAALAAIRTKLLATGDPHLQARLLLQYSACAASPGAKTAAAIDFLFSFLQQNQNQNQTETSAEAGAGAKPPADSSGSSGAIVVGAIVRGLRQLLAVKAAVVEPMIQVDAMGEQLMQCMSVGEDFKLRRDMMRIVVDCLMLTRRFTQVETLLHTCVQDHDAGMQAICLRGYLRLHDAGQRFVASATTSPEAQDEVTDYFDRLATFVLFAQSEEVRVLAARVLVALAELNPQLEIPRSTFFPSSLASNSAMSSPLLLPEKTFYVLCMAGNDASASVRVEVARCLRGFGRVPSSEVVEHAVVKTQIDEVVVDLPAEDVEMKTCRMMSSGMLLSLLDDADVEVAVEASRTIARLSELAMVSEAGSGRWSQRALERAIAAHLDVLPRAKTWVVASGSRNPRLRQVLVNSLHRLLVCRHELGLKTDFAMANADLNGLIRGVAASPEDDKPVVVDTLLVLLHCDLSSASVVQRLVDVVLDTAAAASSDHIQSDEDDEVEADGCWDMRLLSAVQALSTKCASALQMDVALMNRVRQEEARQRRGRRSLLGQVCRALLGSSEPPEDEKERARDQSDPSTGKSHLFFLTNQSAGEPCSTAASSSQAVDSMKVLRSPPADGDIAVYLKAIHRLRSTFGADDLQLCYRLTETLVRLRQHVQSFPYASAVPAPTTHSYVSMEAMLSTSPSMGSSYNSGNPVLDRNDQATAAQPFARLNLPVELQSSCQEMVELVSSIYIKAFALSSALRAELLQCVLLGRVGLVLASLQSSDDSLTIVETIRWLAQEAARLRFLLAENQRQGEIWFPIQFLTDVDSLDELKRTFVAVVRKAWPVALAEATAARVNGDYLRRRPQAFARATITQPAASVKPEPLEITANWPFEQRVRCSLTHIRDVTQVYIKSVLPNGDATLHHVPVACVRYRGPRQHVVDHTISLTVSPFSDPTAFTVAVCLGHPALPGGNEMPVNAFTSRKRTPITFTEISASVRVAIFHRTSSTLKPALVRSTTK